MAESLAIRIKNSFPVNKSVITEQNCQQYFKKELLNSLKSIANNSKANIKISETFEIAAGKYCSFSAEGLEAILTHKYTWNAVEKINKVNLQKFGCCLFDCIKEIKNLDNLDKLDNIRLQIGENIINVIDLKFSSKNENDKDFSYVKECSNKIVDMTDEDKINKEIIKCFNKFITISYVDESAMKNKTKTSELTFVESRTETAEEILELCPEEGEKKKEIAQGGGGMLNKAAEQSQQKLEIRDKSGSLRENTPSFWQKLSQKTTQLLAISWDFIKNKLIGSLFPTFFSTKIN